MEEEWKPTILGFALLQVLSRHPSSGYDLKKFFYESIGRSWYAYDTQIYRELKKLHAHGYVTGEGMKGLAGPPRVVYTITDDGIAALVEWLSSPIQTNKLKDELGLRVWTVNLFPPGELVQLIERAREQWLAALDHMREGLLRVEQSTEHEHAGYQALDRRLSIEYVKAMTEAKIGWAERAIAAIEAAEQRNGH